MDVLNTVLDVLEYLRAFNPASVVVRMVVAMVCGGMIGMERASKRRAAGFRTYMVVCMGATLAMLLNQYIDPRSGRSPRPPTPRAWGRRSSTASAFSARAPSF